MTEEGRARHQALADRLKAKREAREAELKRREAGEREMCAQDADLTRMEELATEVCITYEHLWRFLAPDVSPPYIV